MADLYKVRSENIVGGPGRLVCKPYDGTFPETIEDVISANAPYELAEGWKEIGATNDGITVARGFDTEEFEVDQVVGAVDTDITSWTHTLETDLAENTVENRQIALIGGQIIESPPERGAATTLTKEVGVNATMLTVTSVEGFIAGGYVEITEGDKAENRKISRVQGSILYLTSPVKNAYSASASVAPITRAGYKRIGYGTASYLPEFTFALISQKKDDSLYMMVIRKAKVSGDDKEQSFSKEKRLLPLQLTAFPVDGVPQDENVYYEIEQIL